MIHPAVHKPAAEVPPTPEKHGGVRRRAILLGLILIPLNTYWVIAMEEFRKSGDPTTMSLFFHAVFTLMVLQAANALAHRRAPRLALTRAELLTIYAMVAVGTSVASRDIIQVFLPTWAHATWFARPENQWETTILPDVRGPLLVRDLNALKDFYAGRSTLYTVEHLRAWLPPVLIWSAFLALLQVVMLCLNVIIRKQWTDNEKLSFPIAQLPLDMTSSVAGRVLWGNRWMWVGFALAASLDIVNGLHYLIPTVPYLNVKIQNMQQYFPPGPWQKVGFTPVSFYPFVIGIGFLLPADLSFSCWFFYLFFKLQILVGAFAGWEGSMGYEGNKGSLPYVNEQGIGGYLTLFGVSLFMARTHLARVWQMAFPGRGTQHATRNTQHAEDARTYRNAFLGLGASMAALVAFSVWVGFSWWLAVLFFLLYFAIIMTITRIRAELGPPVHDLHFGGPDRILVTALGTGMMGKGNEVGLSLFFGFNRAYRGVAAPYQLEAFRMGALTGVSMRRMAFALLLAAPVGALAASWAMLHWSYIEGMANTRESYRFGSQAWYRLDNWMHQPWAPNWGGLAGIGAGAFFAWVLMWGRLRLAWFPFHPIGYAISANWAMNCVWTPILIAWLAKVLVMRYGGGSTYRAAIPFALGLILGEFIVGSLWSILGLIFGVSTYEFWLF